MVDELTKRDDSAGSGDDACRSPSTSTSMVEDYTCSICYELLVLPTTLTCGHNFCRHCLAQWFELGKKAECPSCRQKFNDVPKVNSLIQTTLSKLFPTEYEERKQDVLSDEGNNSAISKFETILKKRYDSDELKVISCSLIFGVVLTVVLSFCLYLALHWGASESELLVRKPLSKWTEENVGDWLADIGLGVYKEKFKELKINGLMLSEVEPEDLADVFSINNTLHQRIFFKSLNYTIANGVKAPTNLWEYKALYPGYSTFLLYAMGHTPRLALLYLYKYDSEGYSFYQENVLGCCKHSCNNTQSEVNWSVVLSFLVTPELVAGKFAICFLDVHYWTSRFIIAQCLIKAVIQVFSMISLVTNLNNFSLKSTISEPFLMFCMYYIVSNVWWVVPTIIRDILFYAEIYFSPIFYFKQFIGMLRNE